jgi:predicted transcriptional regulator
MAEDTRELLPRDMRHARARASTPPPSQRDMARLLCTSQPQIARLERGKLSARGLLREVVLAFILAQGRGADLRKALDRSTPPGERLACVFRAAYPEEATK